jgi:hypothetical protein
VAIRPAPYTRGAPLPEIASDHMFSAFVLALRAALLTSVVWTSSS